MSFFSETRNFSAEQVYVSKSINRIELKLPPALSLLYSEKNGMLFRYLDRMFVTYSIPEGNVTLTGKIAQGKAGPTALIDTDNG